MEAATTVIYSLLSGLRHGSCPCLTVRSTEGGGCLTSLARYINEVILVAIIERVSGQAI